MEEKGEKKEIKKERLEEKEESVKGRARCERR